MGEPVSQAVLERSYAAMCRGVRPPDWDQLDPDDAGSGLDPEPLTEVDELVVESLAAQVGVKDRRRVDELGGLFEPAGVEIGQGQGVAGVEPGERAGGIVLQPQALDVDVERVDLEPAVGVAQVAEQPVARSTVGRPRQAASERRASRSAPMKRSARVSAASPARCAVRRCIFSSLRRAAARRSA